MSKELKAFNRIMETYGKTNSLEGTYDDFLTIKRALLELKTIKEANPNEALEVLDKTISPLLEPILAKYEDDLSDRINANYFVLKQALVKAQEDEKLKVDICEMFGLDNLFPYNDTKAILKELEEYMGRKNQLWVDFMKISKQFKEQEKFIDIIKRKGMFISAKELNIMNTYEDYKNVINERKLQQQLMQHITPTLIDWDTLESTPFYTEEEFNIVKDKSE